MTLPAQNTFTGSDGSAWPSWDDATAWAALVTAGTWSAGPTASIQGNAGRIAGTVSAAPANTVRATTPSPTGWDREQLFTGTIKRASLNEFPFVLCRYIYFGGHFGYALRLTVTTGKSTTYGFALYYVSSGTWTKLVEDQGVTNFGSTATTIKFALRAVNVAGGTKTLVQAKAWDSTLSEPAWVGDSSATVGTTWGNVVDGSLAAMRSAELTTYGAAVGVDTPSAVAIQTDFDNLKIEHPNALDAAALTIPTVLPAGGVSLGGGSPLSVSGAPLVIPTALVAGSSSPGPVAVVSTAVGTSVQVLDGAPSVGAASAAAAPLVVPVALPPGVVSLGAAIELAAQTLAVPVSLPPGAITPGAVERPAQALPATAALVSGGFAGTLTRAGVPLQVASALAAGDVAVGSATVDGAALPVVVAAVPAGLDLGPVAAGATVLAVGVVVVPGSRRLGPLILWTAPFRSAPAVSSYRSQPSVSSHRSQPSVSRYEVQP